MKNALKKANKEFDRKSDDQLKMIYPAIAYVLWRDFGWRKQKIFRRFEKAKELWIDCELDPRRRSLLEIFEDETGIEIRLDGDKSYHDYFYLDSKKPMRHLTAGQMILIRQQQFKWVAPMLLSVICLAIYRMDGFGAERLSKLIGAVDEIRKDLGEFPDKYKKLLETETDITVEELVWEYLQR